MDVMIVYNKDEQRSEAIIDDEIIGVCEYEIINDKWAITHTAVDQKFGGQGIAKKLVLKIVDEARINGVKILPICSYAKKMLENNEEYKDCL